MDKMDLFGESKDEQCSKEIIDSSSSKNANRKYKDSIFCKIFSNQDALFELYKELHPEDTTTTKYDLEQVTLGNSIVNDYYNDLGFLVHDKLIVLVEEQSTVCYNMPMRFLIYVAHEYGQYIKSREIPLYGVKMYSFPKPEFFVVDSTGKLQDILKLSDAFSSDDSSLELKVKIINEHTLNDAPNILAYLNFVKEVDSTYHRTKNIMYSLSQGLHKVNGKTIVDELIRKEGMNMSSLAEERFNKEKIIEGLERSALDKAKDLALEDTVQTLRKFGISKEKILTELTEQGKDPIEVARILDTLD